MSEPATQVPLVVVGAGPGGYAAAFHAADRGVRTLLVDPDPDPGGVCLYRGCIPSKALLHVSHVIQEARRARAWGVEFTEPKIDLDRLRAWKDEVVGGLTGGLGGLRRRREVDHVRGRARFVDGHTLRIETSSGEERRLEFEHAIVATGSRPLTLPGLPNESSRVWDSTDALALPELPERLLIVGGGYIGLELGTVYASLGSRVTVVEMLGGLLPGVDRDLVRPLQRRLESEFEEILLETRVAEVEELEDANGGLRVVLEGANVGDAERRFDHVLVAIGRRPNSDGLGLEATSAEVDRSGFLRVDRRMRTAAPSIFAIGDLVGQPMLAHKASHEARVAVDAILGGKSVFEPAAIPAVVFTDPEIAWCGLTESEAKQRDMSVRVSRFPWAASGRATTLGRKDGLTKLVIDEKTERVMGVGLVGPGAGELIGEGVLAVEMAALVSDLKLTIHPHPTLSETLMEAAEAYFGESTHIDPARRPLQAKPPS
jgi:dihydrolipoamide dehydrogenase